MSTPESGEVFREEVRGDYYYGGNLFVIVNDPDPHEHLGVVLRWDAFSGGSAILRLDWDEIDRLIVALKEAKMHKPDWLA